MTAAKFIADMLAAGCYLDGRKVVIPEDVAKRAGVTPGYFYIHEPVNGVGKVEKFLPDGTLEWIQ